MEGLMSVKTTAAVAFLGATMVWACGGSRPAAKDASASGAQSASGAAAQGQLAVAAGDFGVPECDQYMKKYLACIDTKVPDMLRPTLKQALEQSKAAWKQAAATPQGRAGLAAGCTQAEATAKASMQAYGCQW
jgi:hypothetical protein